MSVTHADRWVDFSDACVMWALERPKSIIGAELVGSAAHTAVDRWCNTLQKIVGGRMEEPGAVTIGGKRGGVAVVVEFDEVLLNKAKRTQMRVAGHPQKRGIRGAAGRKNGARFAFRVLGRSDDAINGRPRGVQEIHRDVVAGGIQLVPRVAHDGWGATVALPWEDLQMAHTAVTHLRGEVVAVDTDARFPEEMCLFTTNHV